MLNNENRLTRTSRCSCAPSRCLSIPLSRGGETDITIEVRDDVVQLTSKRMES